MNIKGSHWWCLDKYNPCYASIIIKILRLKATRSMNAQLEVKLIL